MLNITDGTRRASTTGKFNPYSEERAGQPQQQQNCYGLMITIMPFCFFLFSFGFGISGANAPLISHSWYIHCTFSYALFGDLLLFLFILFSILIYIIGFDVQIEHTRANGCIIIYFFFSFFLVPSSLQSALIRGKCNGQQAYYSPHHQMNLIFILSLRVIHMPCFLFNRVYCSIPLPLFLYIWPGWPILSFCFQSIEVASVLPC